MTRSLIQLWIDKGPCLYLLCVISVHGEQTFVIKEKSHGLNMQENNEKNDLHITDKVNP